MVNRSKHPIPFRCEVRGLNGAQFGIRVRREYAHILSRMNAETFPPLSRAQIIDRAPWLRTAGCRTFLKLPQLDPCSSIRWTLPSDSLSLLLPLLYALFQFLP
jgi:hypothetical protein